MKKETSRVGRIIKMLTTLRSGQSFNVERLSSALRISRRSVFRDLQDLRKAGIPVCYNGKNQCYTVKTELFWPINSLSDQETLSLLLLVHKAKDCIHLPFNDLALLAAKKIEKTLSSELRGYCCSILEDISVKACRPAKPEVFDKVFLQMKQAVTKRQVVRINYNMDGGHNTEQAEFSPYHMIYVHNAWYVIGKLREQEIRTFKLSQIIHLVLLDKFFVKEQTFNVQEYLGRAWAAVPEGKLYDVKLEFRPEIARSVTEIKWHSTQVVTFAADGSAILEFRVDGLNELVPWILSFGENIRVLRPELLRQRIVRISQKTVEQNQILNYAVVK